MNDLNINYGKGDMYAAFVQTERPAFTDDNLSLINNAVVSRAQNEVSKDISFRHLILKTFQTDLSFFLNHYLSELS